MGKRNYILCGALLALAFGKSSAMERQSCIAVLDQIDNVFSDIHQKISEESQMQITLLKDCVPRYTLCVVVEAPSPKWVDIVKANRARDLTKMVIGEHHAISSLTFVPIQRGRGRCVLSRFGGGTSSVWTIDAWEIAGGKTRVLNTDRAELRGEFKSPEELIRESEKVGRSLK
jgi:hypothetical protein